MFASRKKIGLITLHHSYSYGACLQAFASQLLLQCGGCNEVVFVNYCNKNEQSQNSWLYWRKDRSALSNFTETAKNVFLRRVANKRIAFDDFHASMVVDGPRSSSIDELTNRNFDYLVSGSDQLWNPDIFGGLDPSFFLQFGHADKRVSLAASMGSHELTEQEKKTVKRYLLGYDFLSVRERSLRLQLEELTGTPVSEILDPTLLIRADEWRSHLVGRTSFDEPCPYILLYLIGVSPSYYEEHYSEIVLSLKRLTGYKVLLVRHDDLPHSGVDGVLSRLTPWELVEYIDNASLVISSSFHGIAFSTNFDTPFVAIDNPSNPDRVHNLLDRLGLSSRRIQGLENLQDDLFDLPMGEEGSSTLEAIRAEGLDWVSEIFGRGIAGECSDESR